MTRVELPKDPNYHFMTDMTNQAIKWTQSQKSLTPDKPFFIYFAPGATHAPHHVPKEWIAKYKGKFDQGWDKLREETLARQIKLGVVPAGTKLAPKPEAIKDWDKLSADEKKLFARQMEVFAGFGEYADYEIGRLIQAIERPGPARQHADLLHRRRQRGERRRRHERPVQRDDLLQRRARDRRRRSSSTTTTWAARSPIRHYAAGWAVAGDTPFTWTKQVAGSYGGTRNGMVVHWPKGIKAKGEVRSQWHHVIDIAPTILEAAGLPEPKVVNGTPQTPIEGVSMVYTFDDAKAKDRHKTQYFEIFGNRGIYHDGWLADTVHRAAWEGKPRQPLLEDKWELYHVEEDFSLANDLAAKNPEKLKELQDLFLKEAVKNHVLPLDDRILERMNAALVGRPDLMAGRTSLTVYEGMIGMIGERLHQHQEPVAHDHRRGGDPEGRRERRDPGPGRPLRRLEPVPQGWQADVHLQLPRPAAHTRSPPPKPLPAGKATIRFEFAYDGGGLGKGGTGTIFVNGEKVAEGRIERTQGCVFSADEGADVGADDGTPVTDDYKEPKQVHRQDRQGDDRIEGNEKGRPRRRGASPKGRGPEEGAR